MPIGDIPVKEQGSQRSTIVATYYVYLFTGIVLVTLTGVWLLEAINLINLSEGAYTVMLFLAVGILLHLALLIPFAIIIIIKYWGVPKLSIPAAIFIGAMLCFGLWSLWLQKQPEQAYENTFLINLSFVLYALYGCSATVAGYLGIKKYNK